MDDQLKNLSFDVKAEIEERIQHEESKKLKKKATSRARIILSIVLISIVIKKANEAYDEYQIKKSAHIIATQTISDGAKVMLEAIERAENDALKKNK